MSIPLVIAKSIIVGVYTQFNSSEFRPRQNTSGDYIVSAEVKPHRHYNESLTDVIEGSYVKDQKSEVNLFGH